MVVYRRDELAYLRKAFGRPTPPPCQAVCPECGNLRVAALYALGVVLLFGVLAVLALVLTAYILSLVLQVGEWTRKYSSLSPDRPDREEHPPAKPLALLVVDADGRLPALTVQTVAGPPFHHEVTTDQGGSGELALIPDERPLKVVANKAKSKSNESPKKVSRKPKESPLDHLTDADLYALARERKVKGVSTRWRRATLLEALGKS